MPLARAFEDLGRNAFFGAGALEHQPVECDIFVQIEAQGARTAGRGASIWVRVQSRTGMKL